MKKTIQEKLKQIELRYDVKILYAVESGSRAWGFPSVDSDYDVRFIYIHRPEWYLAIDPQGVGAKRDVIEEPINDLLDISGWEITKALRLFRKTNPPLLEWLHSPILYEQKYSFIDKMRRLETEVFTPNALTHHYLNMAKNNYREYLQGDTVRVKKYFYVLRPLLACAWIENFNTTPPIEFQQLVHTVLQDGILKDQINQLLERKMAGEELDLEPRIPSINAYIDGQIENVENYSRTLKMAEKNPTVKLDELFRDTLAEVWN